MAAFDFGLSADQEARARRLHGESLVVDMLYQWPGGPGIFEELPPGALAEATRGASLWDLYNAAQALPMLLAARGKLPQLKDWWRRSGLTVGSFAMPVLAAGESSKDEAYPAWLGSIPWIRLATSGAAFRQAKAQGVLAVYGNCQPSYGLPLDLDAIDRAYAIGLRVLMLTYNRMDHVGVGCTERVDAGLSHFGVEAVRRCNRLGILVDTSHCGRLTTLDACRTSETPVLANHTGAAGVFAHARCKSDEELDAIAASGGVIGVVAVPFFLGPGSRTVTDMIDHMAYIAARVGWAHVGIGTDWPLQAPHAVLEATLGQFGGELGFRPQDNVSCTDTLVGLSDYRDLPNITRGLVARGCSDDEIRGVLGENFLRVFEQVCG